MTRRFALMLIAAILPTACAVPAARAPSLAPRSAEAIDPRVPIASGETFGPASAELTAELNRLRASANGTLSAFDSLAGEARVSAAAAGPAQSESWIAAQQLLSALVAVRAPVTRALGDVDAIVARQVAARGGPTPGDRLAIEQAAAEISAIDRRQAAVIEAIALSLAR